jgi:hypothetical protein
LSVRGDDYTLCGAPTDGVVRHLTTSQRAAIAADVVPMLRAEAAKRKLEGQKRGGETAGSGRPKNSLVTESAPSYSANESVDVKGKTRDIAAKATGVSGGMVQRALAVKRADPGEFERVKRGEVTVDAAHRKVVENVVPLNKRQKIVENASSDHATVVTLGATFC